jgi:hypothetical protein
VAVEQFLAGRLTFSGIPRVIEAALEATDRGGLALSTLAMCGRSMRGPATFRSKQSVRYHRRSSVRPPHPQESQWFRRLGLLLVLGVLIFVHELGHFLVARWFGVRVLTFSLGFGPKIPEVDARRHGVLRQRHPARRLREDGRRNHQDERLGAPDEFMSKSRWVRFLVYLAGPADERVSRHRGPDDCAANGADVPLLQQRAGG